VLGVNRGAFVTGDSRFYGKQHKPVQDRFWKFVEPEPNSGCWLWIGARQRYGSIKISPTRSGRAHRVSWELEYGSIPDGLSVLHRCDTPACVNPKHLRLGTQADNMREASERQRWSPVRPWRWGLTAQQRIEIRSRLRAERQKDLAAEYGVTPATVRTTVGTMRSIRKAVA